MEASKASRSLAGQDQNAEAAALNAEERALKRTIELHVKSSQRLSAHANAIQGLNKKLEERRMSQTTWACHVVKKAFLTRLNSNLNNEGSHIGGVGKLFGHPPTAG
jgi:predicted RNase H-like nuclease (RuvC/YqgF family)